MRDRSQWSKKVLAVGVLAGFPLGTVWGPAENAADVRRRLDGEISNLVDLYKYFHSHPELSYQEARTSARLATEIRSLGFEVAEKVGGYGVVGVLKNGPGPTVLVRTDMDALPVVENTGLPYASKV